MTTDRRAPRALFAIAALIAAPIACSEDGGGGTPTVESGVEAAKKAKDLTENEIEAFCDAASKAYAKLATPKRLCTIAGIFFTENESDCNNLVTACGTTGGADLDSVPGQSDVGDGVCLLKDPARVAECEATVEEIEACFNDSIIAAKAALEALTCSLAGEIDLDLSGGGPDAPDLPDNPIPNLSPSDLPSEEPACVTVRQQCPALFEGGGDTTDSGVDQADSSAAEADVGEADAGT